ncbi:maestro heat-like repeat-containing protein family member 7 [Chrysemys picta bellii]
MLRGLLSETPSLEKLQHLLEHIHVWIPSKRALERARAIQSSAALLEFATSLPGFDTSSDFSMAGDFVLQLGLHVSHPAEDISRQARGGIYWLHRLLVQKRGKNPAGQWDPMETSLSETSSSWPLGRLED